MAKRMDVKRKLALFKPPEPIAMLSLLQKQTASCYCNGIYEREAKWLLQQLTKVPTKAALSHRVSATENGYPQKERKYTKYCQVVNHLLAVHATDDVKAKEEAEIKNFKELECKSAVRYSEVLWEKLYAVVMDSKKDV